MLGCHCQPSALPPPTASMLPGTQAWGGSQELVLFLEPSESLVPLSLFTPFWGSWRGVGGPWDVSEGHRDSLVPGNCCLPSAGLASLSPEVQAQMSHRLYRDTQLILPGPSPPVETWLLSCCFHEHRSQLKAVNRGLQILAQNGCVTPPGLIRTLPWGLSHQSWGKQASTLCWRCESECVYRSGLAREDGVRGWSWQHTGERPG